MKLIGWKRRLNGEKSGEENGGPKLQVSASSFSNVAFSLGIIYKFRGYQVLQDAAFAKISMKL